MRRLGAFVLVALALGLAACAPAYRDTSATIASAASFDPARYAGLWYEIASYPVAFQAGCTDTRARYTPAGPGVLAVRNTCLRDGAVDEIDGTARVVGPGRLEVRFGSVPFARAPYWVLWVAEDYRSAVVGVPSGRAGWILHRDPVMPADRLEAARRVLAFNGYDLSALRMTPQTAR